MTNWIFLSLISAVLLGFYDVAKKLSLRGNAVPIVLLVNVSVGATIWATMLLLQISLGTIHCPDWLVVDPISLAGHLALAGKSVLVGASWILAFYAMKELPLSIAAPMRATGPVWTLLMAVILLSERPSLQQWLGILVVVGSFWALSVVGSREGIRFRSDRAVWWMVAATLLGACSSIYDKVLLQTLGYRPATVQAWFSIYLVPVMLPLALRWWREQRRTESQASSKFEFRTAILLISPLLLAADMAYFTALADPDALVSIVSPLRRVSVVVALIAGSRMSGEVNLRSKAACVLGILGGIALLIR